MRGNAQVAYANPVDTPQNVGLLSPGGTPQKIELENTDPFGKSGACTSPRKYKLKQGRYKFSVAATVAGVTGPAAVQKFKVVRAT